MELRGLPDFGAGVAVEGASLFAPFDAQGAWLLTPAALEVAEAAGGGPDFLIETVRGRTPLLPPRPYGSLDFRLRARYDLTTALAAARERQAGSCVTPLVAAGGTLRLAGGAIPDDLRRSIPLAWNGLGLARCALRISIESARLLIDSLKGAVLPLHAHADLTVVGVAPRLPYTAHFDPRALLEALAAAADAEGRMSFSAFEACFRRESARLPIVVGGAVAQGDEPALAAALCDRTLQRFGRLIAPPDNGGEVWVAVHRPDDFGAGRFTWNLAEPLLAARPLTLRLDPFAAARGAAAELGLAAVVRDTVVPPLPTGAVAVTVTANLPAEREGVVALGVHLSAPPRPPQRPAAVKATALLEPPTDSARVTLRLAAREPVAFSYSAFAVLADAHGAQEVTAAPVEHTGEQLELSVDDFPVEFVAVSAEPALLELGEVRCTLRRPAPKPDAPPLEHRFELTPERPSRSLALPRGASADATLAVEVAERGGPGLLRLGPLPAADLAVERFSFREYGPQRVAVRADLPAGAPPLLVELLPEGAPETAASIGRVQLRPGHPSQEWRYFAGSPFAPGYRYRIAGRNTAWSAVQSPFEPLLPMQN
jgi:hypothetical protein